MGTDGDGEDDKGEVAKMDVSEKQCSPSEGKHGDIDVDDDNDDIEDDHGQEEGEEEEEDGEDEEEIEMDSQKRETDETSQHGGISVEKSNVGDASFLHDEYTTMQQGQATVVPQQKHKVFDLVNYIISIPFMQEIITTQNAVALNNCYNYLHICSCNMYLIV